MSAAWNTSENDYASVVPSLSTRIAAALVASSAALFLSSCSGPPSDAGAHPRHTADEPVITGEPAGYNTDDVAFANNMIPHDQQGIDVSGLVPDRSSNSGLVAFAAQNAAALRSDMQVLEALRVQWKENQDDQRGGGKPGSGTRGMIDNTTIGRLNSLHGTEFDRLWLGSMISLDEGAIEIANAEIANGKNIDAIALAKQIAKSRQADTRLMQQMLAG